jgi:hypothetical protein
VKACPTAETQTFSTKMLPLTADPAVIDSTAEEMSKVTGKCIAVDSTASIYNLQAEISILRQGYSCFLVNTTVYRS